MPTILHILMEYLIEYALRSIAVHTICNWYSFVSGATLYECGITRNSDVPYSFTCTAVCIVRKGPPIRQSEEGGIPI